MNHLYYLGVQNKTQEMEQNEYHIGVQSLSHTY